MTDDLVKRLRMGEYDPYWTKHIPTDLTKEAADRIEKLEAALRLILDNDRNLHKPLEDMFAEFCIEARKALEGKDER